MVRRGFEFRQFRCFVRAFMPPGRYAFIWETLARRHRRGPSGPLTAHAGNFRPESTPAGSVSAPRMPSDDGEVRRLMASPALSDSSTVRGTQRANGDSR